MLLIFLFLLFFFLGVPSDRRNFRRFGMALRTRPLLDDVGIFVLFDGFSFIYMKMLNFLFSASQSIEKPRPSEIDLLFVVGTCFYRLSSTYILQYCLCLALRMLLIFHLIAFYEFNIVVAIKVFLSQPVVVVNVVL